MEVAISADVTAFILAGGKSTRMGVDKAFVEYGGRTLLALALAAARTVTRDVRIVGAYGKFAAFAPVVEDIFPGCGPLAGIHAALRSSSAPLNLMLAVDTPLVPAGFLQYLISEARSSSAMVVVARDGAGWQPLCGIYRPGFADQAEAALLAGRYRIDPLFETNATRVIDSEELRRAGFSGAIFRNLNTPGELEAERRA